MSSASGSSIMLEQPRPFQEFHHGSTLGLKREAEEEESQNGSKKKRSRWGPQEDKMPAPAVSVNLVQGVPPPAAPVMYPQFMGGVAPPPPPPGMRIFFLIFYAPYYLNWWVYLEYFLFS